LEKGREKSLFYIYRAEDADLPPTGPAPNRALCLPQEQKNCRRGKKNLFPRERKKREKHSGKSKNKGKARSRGDVKEKKKTLPEEGKEKWRPLTNPSGKEPERGRKGRKRQTNISQKEGKGR